MHLSGVPQQESSFCTYSVSLSMMEDETPTILDNIVPQFCLLDCKCEDVDVIERKT